MARLTASTKVVSPGLMIESEVSVNHERLAASFGILCLLGLVGLNVTAVLEGLISLVQIAWL